MPVISGTPESILPRSDSKNPATTCKGLTSNGRPCRRSLASPKNGEQGVFAMLPHLGNDNVTAAAYFCWQHKDQVANLVHGPAQILKLQQRSSIDTLIEKLGVLDPEDDKKKARRLKQGMVKRDTFVQQCSNVSGSPVLASEDPFGPGPNRHSVPRPRQVQKRKERIHISFSCCKKEYKGENLPPARPRPTVMSSRSASIPYQTSLQAMPNTLEDNLAFIPFTLPHSIRVNLMAEIARPLSSTDQEPGYIYLFWLTPKDVPKEAAGAVSSLLAPQDQILPSKKGRSTSDFLREYNHVGHIRNLNKPKTIMLKIGRATNVHRRMIQWSQQCGHHITLLRYYPNPIRKSSTSPSTQKTSSSSRRSSRSTPGTNPLPPRDHSPSPTQKAPLIARVERLIHLELAPKQVKRSCEGCGKEHREWFEVEANRQATREVDAVVRRWISWAQQRGN